MANTVLVACVLINHDFSFVSSLWLYERLEVSVVWDVSACCIVDMYQRLVGICCFLLQGGKIYFIFPSVIRNLKYRLHAHTSHIYTYIYIYIYIYIYVCIYIYIKHVVLVRNLGSLPVRSWIEVSKNSMLRTAFGLKEL